MKTYEVKVCDDGSKSWYINGKRHREDGPAVIYADGSQSWYLNGKLHREDGPAIIYANGSQFWYLNGKRHREDGPAVIYPDGRQEWWLNNKLHREDGPAVIRADGSQEWWLDGNPMSQEEHQKRTAKAKELSVAELVAHLQTLPQDHKVYFRGYSCGSVWHAPVRLKDFIEETHLDTGEQIVEITAEWN